MATTRYTVFDGQIVSENRAGVLHDYVPDALGSTVALLDNTQTQTDQWTYWPYGESVRLKGSTQTTKLFIGTSSCNQDSASRTSMHHRGLDTIKGRWMTEDPIGYAGGDGNLYRYVVNDPIDLREPSGLQPPPTKSVTDPRYPAWKKCMSNAISTWCTNVNLRNSTLYAYVWCIIDGESQWNPTNVNPKVVHGGHACGLMQITPWLTTDCTTGGYPRYKTNPCSNIGCGVMKLCSCLNGQGKQQQIGDCSSLFNAINTPEGRF